MGITITFQKAQRRKSRLRLALAGPAGSGKTFSALLIAFGIGGRVAMIDTERGSGEMYDNLGDYDSATISAPFTPDKYINAIKEAEAAKYNVIIIDSLSHAWAGQGGLLDVHGLIADKTGNSWTAWRQVTPRHNELVESMLQSRCHIIATMRTKMDYVQVSENGKTVVKKVGMNPIQKDGMEYEFTLFLDLDHSHIASASKDRTSLFDGQFFKPSVETGKILIDWLENAAEPRTPNPEPLIEQSAMEKTGIESVSWNEEKKRYEVRSSQSDDNLMVAVYWVTRVNGKTQCSCPIGQHGKTCRHLEMVRDFAKSPGITSLVTPKAIIHAGHEEETSPIVDFYQKTEGENPLPQDSVVPDDILQCQGCGKPITGGNFCETCFVKLPKA